MRHRTRDYHNTKIMRLPDRYKQGFLKDFDERTQAFQLLMAAYEEILVDLGGAENLTHIQIALVERFVFLEFAMRILEKRIAENPKKTAALMGKWVQSVNSLSGLAKTLGLHRRKKQIESSLKTYVGKKKKAI